MGSIVKIRSTAPIKRMCCNYEKNAVIKVLDEFIGTDKIEFISGKIENVGCNKFQLSEGRGSVYGIVVKINSEEEKKDVFKINEKEVEILEWKSIGDKYYPLYWGKDKNMGSRLDVHTKSSDSTWTIQLNKIGELKDKEIIYGAMLCSDSKNVEDELHESYPDILKTKTGK